MKQQVYLDYNATAPMRPEVITAVTNTITAPANASSVHSFGRKAHSLIEDARRKVTALTGADHNNVIFNSGATEANNTVLKHFAPEGVLVSAIEHPSALDVIPDAPKIPVNNQGLIDLSALETLLTEHKPALVSIMLVNNETGVIQPMQDISALVKKHGALLHSDCVQAAGRIPLAINELGIDFMTLSAHKIGGPQGVGALIMGLCGITPILHRGGGQEKGARPGTENVAGIGGFGIAAELAHKELKTLPSKLEKLQEKLEQGLLSAHADIKIASAEKSRATNTTMAIVPGTKSETLLMSLDLEGIAVSNGSACSSGKVEPSHVLKAMGYCDEDAASAIRFSMGWNTTEEDIDHTLEIWSKIITRLKH